MEETMNKANKFGLGIAACIAVTVVATTYDTTPVIHESCEVVDTRQGGGGKTSVKYYIQTENCGELWSSKKVAETVEPGEHYDFTATGIFTWEKKVTGLQKAEGRHNGSLSGTIAPTFSSSPKPSQSPETRSDTFHPVSSGSQ